VYSHVISTLAELRLAAETDTAPGRGLAARAGALAANSAMTPLLLRCAEHRYSSAARLWLQISAYLDDPDEIEAVLQLAAQCASIGGNTTFARNCIKQAADARRQRRGDVPPAAAAPSLPNGRG
jgi:hypothetical protein